MPDAEKDVPAGCGCWRCLEARGERIWFMVVCGACGNKRCPHAADHNLDCTGSNDVGQPGSAYEHGSGAATARRMTTVLPPAEPVVSLSDVRCDGHYGPGMLREWADCPLCNPDESTRPLPPEGGTP